MKIACLGWGSLIWKPGALPTDGLWRQDGPHLPIEFSRVGDGGELATAICINAPLSQVFWTLLEVASVAEACEALRGREQIPSERDDGIGSLISSASGSGPLAEWAESRGLSAVIWTALPPRFANTENRIPSVQDVIGYLTGLTGETWDHARNYIEQMPVQISTPYRQAIAEALGWVSPSYN